MTLVLSTTDLVLKMHTTLGEMPDELIDKLILAGHLTITEVETPGLVPGVASVKQTEFKLLLRRDSLVRVVPVIGMGISGE